MASFLSKKILLFQPDALIASTAAFAIGVGASANLVELERLGMQTIVIMSAHFVDRIQDQAEFSELI